MTTERRIRLVLHLFVGGTVALAAIVADRMLGSSPGWGAYQLVIIAGGLLLVLSGFVSNIGVISRASTYICLTLISVLFFLALCEVVFRIIGFDFAKEKEAWLSFPPYYRQPIIPTGEVFFRRPGPEEWTGQVLYTSLRELSASPNPYSNEAVITVKYDRLGFRNPDNMSDWDIAVAGDSFTELGNLRYEDLFTTILGESLNLRVLNLGTSYTGPLTQLSYLKGYGISDRTKHAFIVFFEGNDLDDLAREYQALIRWKESGQREYREFRRQPSAVKAFYGFFKDWARRLSGQNDSVNAYFKSPQGDIPITLIFAPPGRHDLSEDTKHQLDYFFAEYARFQKERQITGWLAYMPSKIRVLYGQMEFTNRTRDKFRSWRPTDLPALIAELCDQYGIRFIDLSPALIRETRRNKRLLYNSIYDMHLNAQGSLVVGQELTREFLRQKQ